ncbi:globin domain-containing protein [Pseudogracilibacillus sp. ICA-222130]|uniref:globin domain-containing protein n=1 Tax=Pseudogracilibacillus sp. ICA-222130 TaxID=3134655 RepID=UPI0030BF9C0F
MSNPQLRLIYDEIGAEKIEELVHAFYPKVYADPDLIPIFDEVEMPEIMRKQQLFLTQFTGGPALFSMEFGAPRMRFRHLPHEITPTRARAWLRCMKEAFIEVGLWDEPVGQEFYQRLMQVAAVMVNTEED